MTTQKCKTCGEDIKDSAYKAFGLCSQCGRKPALPKMEMSVAQESAVLNDIDIEIQQEPTVTVESDNSPATVAVPAPAVETAKEKSAEQIKREKEIAAIVNKWGLDLEAPVKKVATKRKKNIAENEKDKTKEQEEQIKQNKEEIADIIKEWEQKAPDRVALFDEDGALEKLEAEKMRHEPDHLRKIEKVYGTYMGIAHVLIITFSIIAFTSEPISYFFISVAGVCLLAGIYFGLLCADCRNIRHHKKVLLLKELIADVKLVNSLKAN